MEANIAALVAAVVVIIGLSVTYAKTFGPYQERLTEVVVTAMDTPSKYKPLINMTVGILLASIMTVVAAYTIGMMVVIPVGIVAGIFASTEAQRIHDETKPPS